MDKRFSGLELEVFDSEFSYVLFSTSTDPCQLVTRLDRRQPSALFISGGEISAVLPAETELSGFEVLKVEPGWRCFGVVGELAFGNFKGLMATITSALTAYDMCTVSSFKTDWFFTKNLNEVIAVLSAQGWKFRK